MKGSIMKSIFKYFFSKKRIVILLIELFLFNIPFISLPQTKEASYSVASSLITECAKAFKTDSVSLAATSIVEGIEKQRVNDILSTCQSYNSYKTNPNGYNFYLAYNSRISDFLVLDDLDSSFSIVPHKSSGKPTTNAKGKYMHGELDLELMFDAENTNTSYDTKTSYVYLRESTATQLIEKVGTISSYSDLVKNYQLPVTYVHNGASFVYKYGIANIIKEDERNDKMYFDMLGDYLTLNTFYDTSLPSFDDYTVFFEFGKSSYDTRQYMPVLKDFLNISYYDYQFDLSSLKESSDVVAINNKLSIVISIFEKENYLNSTILISISYGSMFLLIALILILIIKAKLNHYILEAFSLFAVFSCVYTFYFLLEKFFIPFKYCFITSAIVASFVVAMVGCLLIIIVGEVFLRKGEKK